jgi:Flp pilus assembly protein TadG
LAESIKPVNNVDSIQHCVKPTLAGYACPASELSQIGPNRLDLGQSLIEFTITVVVALIVLTVTIQFAIIGDAALAVSQLASAGARYAAFHPREDDSTIFRYMRTVASPAISERDGANIKITLAPTANSRKIGSLVQVSVVYNLRNKLFLPNPFLGINFPTTLSGIQTTMINDKS